MRNTLITTLAGICALQLMASAQSFPFGMNVLPDQSSQMIANVFAVDPATARIAYRVNRPLDSARPVEGYVGQLDGVPVALNVTSGPQDIHYDATPSLDTFVLTSNSRGRFEAMYHQLGQVPVSLGVAPGYDGSAATKLSRAGDIVFGYDLRLEGLGNLFLEPFRWTPTTGRQALGHPRANAIFTQFTDISDDGNIAVGYSGVEGIGRAFRWTAADGYTFLAPPVGGVTVSASGVTPDGSVIVGSAGVDISSHAAIWRDVTQPPQLLNDWYSSTADFVAQDGALIIGQGKRAPSGPDPLAATRAFIWTEETGMLTATDYLRRVGVALPEGAVINQFNYVSDDGTMLGCNVFVGTSAYGALIVIPSPASALVLLPVLFSRRRRR